MSLLHCKVPDSNYQSSGQDFKASTEACWKFMLSLAHIKDCKVRICNAESKECMKFRRLSESILILWCLGWEPTKAYFSNFTVIYFIKVSTSDFSQQDLHRK